MPDCRTTAEQAFSLLQQKVQPVRECESLPLAAALGRIAAADVTAPLAMPFFDRSPLDGYALCSEDIADATRETPVTLPVVHRCYAEYGEVPTLHRGEACRIMTGAAIPLGADCVLQQEATDGGEEHVTVYRSVKAGQNICRRGSDLAEGSLLLPRGEVITPAHIGLLAGLGIETVSVYRRLCITLVVVGSELIAPGEALCPGGIYDSNGPMLQARLHELPCEVRFLRTTDDPDLLRDILTEAFGESDAVITTGGASVGEKDYLPRLARELSDELLFSHLAMKPGSHMFAGKYGDSWLFCLSGNPFAAAATLELFTVPALWQLAGRPPKAQQRTKAVLCGSFGKASPQRRFLRATYRFGEVHLAECNHVSGTLYGFTGCNCLIDVPAGSAPLQQGDTVEVVLFE